MLAAAARFGPMPLAKTGYVLPKAWTWAQRLTGFDHVLAYWGNYAGTCAYAYHRLLERSVPFSIWLHAGADLYYQPVFMRRKLLYADNIITCCEFNREYIARNFPDIRAAVLPKTHVVHHGLDLAEFPYRPEGRPANRVIAVGRLSRLKGFDHLLRAARVLADRGVDARVELVGDGDERNALQRLAADLGIADRVWFRGWLPFAEARRAMAEATLLVHPSGRIGDGLPNVVREAMALGTPVIGSRVAGLPDALRDDCGVLVPPRNPEALADAVARLLADPATCRRLARNARRRVEERYDLAKNGEVLARLLRGTRRGAARPAANGWRLQHTGTAAC
jgi:glycosyltransferase involved in cell wall biosynthesis